MKDLIPEMSSQVFDETRLNLPGWDPNAVGPELLEPSAGGGLGPALPICWSISAKIDMHMLTNKSNSGNCLTGHRGVPRQRLL